MNEIITSGQTMLPETIEDLTQFVLVGKAKLQAYMLKLQTVNKLSVAQEIRDQTLKEAQEVSNAVIAAEQRIGEILLSIPKASGHYAESENRPVSKNTVIKEQGYSKDEAHDYQQMAKHPEVVKAVIAKAMNDGEVVTKASVMREIKFYKERIKALENQEPKMVRVEVIPDDYEDLKKQLALAEREADRLERDYRKARTKIDAQGKMVESLKAKLGADKIIKNADRDIRYFTDATHDYIRRYGGHVWSFEQIQNVDEETKKDFIKAIKTLDGFAQQLIRNMEGSLNG
jgi:DNA repair exonuclease SbcCD ATPase subunit